MSALKVFFIHSPRSSTQNAKLIYKTIKELGHIHTNDFAEKTEPKVFYKVDESEWAIRYVDRIKEMDRADVCVLETSIPSTAMGQLAQLAVGKFKPTILLYTGNNKQHFFLGMAKVEKRVQMAEYDQGNIKEVLKFALAEAQEFLNTRFTLLFSPEIIAHLEKIKKSGKSRSEYIRKLIREDMGK